MRSGRHPLLERAGVVLTIGMLTTFMLRATVVSGRVFFQRDVQLMWYTQISTFVRAVEHGEWPVWGPWIGFGQPLLADASMQVLYPFTWLSLLLEPWAYYTLLVAFHVAFAGVGLYLLARALEVTRAGALIAGVLWIASGPLLSCVEMWMQLTGAAWIPYATLAGVRAMQSGRLAWIVGWAGCEAMQIYCGAPETALMTAVGVAVYALGTSPGNALRARVARVVMVGGAAGAVALGLSAAQWVPALDVASRSLRADAPLLWRTFWSVHPVGLLQVLFPVPLHELALRPELRAALFEGREPLFPSLYLGMPTLGLACAALVGRRRRLAIVLAACVVGVALMALGRHAPIYAAAVALVPPLKAFRYPVKATIGLSFYWALLCGCGFDSWSRGEPRGARRGILVVVVPLAVCAALAALAAFLLHSRPDAWAARFLTNPGGAYSFAQMLGSTVPKLMAASAVSAAVVVLAILSRRWPGARASAIAAGLLAVTELLAVHDGLAPTAPKDLYTYRPPALAAATPPDHERLYVYDYYMAGKSEQHLHRSMPYAVRLTSDEWPFPAAIALAMRLSLYPPSAGVWDVRGSFDRDTPGIAPLHLAQLNDLMAFVEGTPAFVRLLQLGAVTRVVSRHTTGLEMLRPIGSFEAMLPEQVGVFEVPDALPAAYAVSGVRTADGAAALRVLIDPQFEPAREVVLAGGVPSSPSPTFRGSAQIAALGTDRVRVEADLNEPGLVVLVDGYDPGWTATVDGVRAAVLRANVGFRAVRASGGHHVIEYAYRPPSVRRGVAVTAVTLALIPVALLVARRRRRGTADGRVD